MNVSTLAARGLLVGLVLLTPACGSSSAQAPSGARAEGEPVQVFVRNDNIRDIEVYLDRDGRRRRIGIVTGKDDVRLSLDRALFPGQGRLRFALVPFGQGAAVLTRPVLVNRGESVVITIGIDMALTRVEVRR